MKFNQIHEPFSSPVEMLRRQSTVKGELKTVLMILAFPPCMILVFWEGLYAGGFPSEQTLVVLEVVMFPYVIAVVAATLLWAYANRQRVNSKVTLDKEGVELEFRYSGFLKRFLKRRPNKVEWSNLVLVRIAEIPYTGRRRVDFFYERQEGLHAFMGSIVVFEMNHSEVPALELFVKSHSPSTKIYYGIEPPHKVIS